MRRVCSFKKRTEVLFTVKLEFRRGVAFMNIKNKQTKPLFHMTFGMLVEVLSSFETSLICYQAAIADGDSQSPW